MNSRTPSRYLHPSNALTYGSLLAGLLAVIAAAERSSWHLSGALITSSVVLDTLDGRFARLFPRSEDQSAFGVQLDSLVDAVVFGFVPIACLYLLLDFGASATARFWWTGAALAYLVSALTRLGCYNLYQVNEDHFVGLPTTLAALFLSTLFLASPPLVLSVLALVVCAYTMVAPIAIPRPRGVALAVFATWITLVLALHLLGAGRELGRRSGVAPAPAHTAAPLPPASADSLRPPFQHSTGVFR
jgi:CDP-diacylglycerol--serine O-phosphatidyltransferase